MPLLAAAVVLGAGCTNDIATADAGVCSPACAEDARCVAGRCLPVTCGAETCAPGNVCSNGQCTPSGCVGVICPANTACTAPGVCVPTSCGDMPCGPGEVCIQGMCRDAACVGVICPGARVCRRGACVEVTADAGPPDSGVEDAGAADGGASVDAGDVDAGDVDAGAPDGGGDADAGAVDAGSADAGGVVDAGSAVDGGAADAGCTLSGSSVVGCPTPVNAAATCVQGRCGVGPCAAGFFDFEPGILGCETACTGTTCTQSDGGMLVLTRPPATPAQVQRGFPAAGSSLGAQVQTNSGFTNAAVLGPSTPAAAGQVEQSNGTYRNRGGIHGFK